MLPDHVFVLDFETTDKDAKTAHPVELAIVPNDGPFIHCMMRPPVPIPPQASAVNQICDDDVAHCEPWESIKPLVEKLVFSRGIAPVLVAHNAEYDKTVLGDMPDLDWICTYKCALIVWPEAPAHGNEVLRYWLKLGPLGRSAGGSAHTALHDALVTQLLLVELLKHASLAQLIAWSKEPARLPRVPLGKHYGETWDKVPGDYLQWLIKQVDMRPDVVHCAKLEIAKRKAGPTKH